MPGDTVLQLAKDVLGDTLHGPVPMRTVARLAEGVIAAEARIAEMRRVQHLYHDALSVIAGHPSGDHVAQWLKAKAEEAMAKTGAAERGEIYAGS